MSAAIDPLLGISDTESATGLERTTLWRRYRTGTFPPPIYIGNRRYWRASEVTAWVTAQATRPVSAHPGAANLLGSRRSA
jgi:predicted DNA-binding transcriptional regulator AlpA